MYDEDAKVLIRPAVAGSKVRVPYTLDVLPPEGRPMLPSDYWRRMESNGEVIISEYTPGQSQEQSQGRSQEQPQQPQRRRSGGGGED